MSRTTLKQRQTLSILVLVALVVAAGLYFASHTKTLSSKTTGTDQSLSQIQKQAKDAAASGANTTPKTSQTGDSVQPGSGSSASQSGTAPVAPNGQFVSSHSLSASASVVSVCNTSAGSTCQISFTKQDDPGKGTVKSLAAQAVDASGSTNWSWTAGSLLGAGTWSVTATAAMSGKTTSANDATNVVVQ